ncbi:MAG: 16S rRNA (cytosine(967)-C(5))-methyltransferase RsmB [Pseudomonadota bacterium]
MNRKPATSARESALEALKLTHAGAFAEQALSQILDSNPDQKPEDRALATELVYGVLRWKMRLDALINRLSKYPTTSIQPDAVEILRVALYQLWFLDRIPAHAAVDQAVRSAKMRCGKPTASFVNAVLRRSIREGTGKAGPAGRDADSLGLYYSHPSWLVRRWLVEMGPDETVRVLEANNSRAPLTLRVNRLKTVAEELKGLWKAHGVEYGDVGICPDAFIVRTGGRPVRRVPGYEEGLFIVQDAASQMIAPLLDLRPGLRVLDACAAPGNKTSHIAALMLNSGEIIATDSDPARADDTTRRLHRMGADTVRVVQGDVTEAGFVKTLGLFDRVLVDAPCTNLGVLRHNPEAKYRIRPQDAAQFREVQLNILRAGAPALRPGGMLVYSVCTVTREETVEVINRFLETNLDFELVGPTGVDGAGPAFWGDDGFFRTFPPPRDASVDGFFAALIRRKPAGTLE